MSTTSSRPRKRKHRSALELRPGVIVDTESSDPDSGVSEADFRAWFDAASDAADAAEQELQEWTTLHEAARYLQLSPYACLKRFEWYDRLGHGAIIERELQTFIRADALRLEVKRLRVAAQRAVWAFTDGTVVHLGGEVEGDSPFADDLRAALANEPTTYDTDCGYWGSSETITVDRDDAGSIDSWLQRLAEPYERDCEMRILERPPSEYAWLDHESEHARICDPPPVFHLTNDQAVRVAKYRRKGGVF